MAAAGSVSAQSESLGGERPVTVIEAIDVVGNEKTGLNVVLSKISVGVGDPVDDERVDASRLRLLATGYFKSVEMSLRRGSRRGRVVLVIDLVERNTIQVSGLYLGFSSVAPIYGGLGIHENNFLGKGVSAGASFVAGKRRRAFAFDVFVPDLSDTRLQLAASGIFVQGAEALIDDDADALHLSYERIGGTLGVGVSVGLAQRIVLEYRLESVTSDPLPNLDPAAVRSAPSIQFDESIVSTLSMTYEYDTRDAAFVPSRGTRVALAVETGTKLIGSSYEFTKYTGEIQLAFSPVQSHALSLRAFGGVVQGQTPFFNQFFLSDHAYFAFGRDSLPRAIGLNFSESNDYDDLIISVGADYSIPLQEGGDFLFRTYAYGGLDISATASLDELQEDLSGRGTGGQIPVSFDGGVRFDTLIGNFTLSVSYILDLVF